MAQHAFREATINIARNTDSAGLNNWNPVLGAGPGKAGLSAKTFENGRTGLFRRLRSGLDGGYLRFYRLSDGSPS